jgi:hypothetical protein
MRVFFGILLIGVAAFALWQWVGVRDSDEIADAPVIASDEEIAGLTESEGQDSDDHLGRKATGSRREAIATPDEPIAWNPFASTSNARELILDSASTFGWTEAAALQTARNWSRACEPARRLESYRDHTFEDAPSTGRFTVDLVPFTDFCSNFPSAMELVSGEARTEIAQAATGDNAKNLDRREIDEMIENDPGLARETLIRQLHQALLNFDEANVTSSILFLMNPGTQAIQTRLPGQYEFWWLEFGGVVESVSISLLCQYHDGCIGKNHPMVLRTCINAWESSGVGCLEPQDVFEAIYQTQTPVEHMMYRALLDQVSHMLIRYRRG